MKILHHLAKVTNSPYLLGLAALVAFLSLDDNPQPVIWVMVTLSSGNRYQEPGRTQAEITDPGGDTTNPAGNPPPPN